MICSQKTGPGIKHLCTSESKRRNICNLIEMQEEKVKQKIVGNTLRNMVDTLDRGRNEIKLSGQNNKKLKVSIGKQKDVEAKICVSTLKKVEKDMDLSRNATLHLKRILQHDVPIEKCVREKLREWDHLADDQLQLHVLDNLQAKISATAAKKDEKGKVIEPGVPACVQSITREVVTVRNVKDHFH